MARSDPRRDPPGVARDGRRLFDYPRAGRRGPLRWVPSIKHVLGLVVLLGSLGFACVGVAYALTDVPDAKNAEATRQSNIWYWSDGTEITRTGATNRQSVSLGDVPRATREAVLAAEDRSFYRDDGISIKGTLRALWRNATGGQLEGGSTITQQYVKNVYLTQEQTLTRKAKEALIAVKLDRTTPKDEILEGYLNTSYFGRGAYGVQAAAQAYYGVDVGELDVARSAYLATLLNAPGAYDVANTTPKGRADALARWNYVLDGMVRSGWLDPAARAGLTFPEPIAQRAAPGLDGNKGYLVDLAKQYLLQHDVVDPARLEAGGYRVYTTFDRQMTESLTRTVRNQLASTLNPDARDADADVRVGAATVEPGTGRVLAVYGGPEYTRQYIDDAARRDVQVGSTFKPFVLAAALRDGVVPAGSESRKRQPVTPLTRYDGDDDVVIRQRDGRPVMNDGAPWRPGNEDGVSYGQVTLDRAMARSINTVYAQLGMDVGIDRVADAAIDAGLPKDTPGLETGASVSLGTATPSALDMAGAYATFAARGTAAPAHPVDRVVLNGENVALPGTRGTRAFDVSVADNVTRVLQDVVEKGTGTRAQVLGRPVAGKTGTTDDNKSAWFIGYTPQLSTAVGMFRQDPVTNAHLSMNGTAGYNRIDGGNLPTRIWTTYMTDALAGEPIMRFPKVDLGDTGLDSPGPVPAPSASAPPTAPVTPAPTGGTTAPPTGGPGGTAPGPGPTPRPPSGGGTATGGTPGGQPSGAPSAGGTATGGTTAGQGTPGGGVVGAG